MSQTTEGLRDKILCALSPVLGYTTHALARELKASPSKVEHELRKLKREGMVVVFITPTNDVTYRLPESVTSKPPKRRATRPFHITGVCG